MQRSDSAAMRDPKANRATESRDSEPSLDSLVAELRRTSGSFERSSDGSWSFVGPDEGFKRFDAYRDRAVAKLAACIADTSKATARVDGRDAPLGVMCYWALRRIAYYEWQTDPEFKDGWPGEIQPTASAAQLRAASAAWKRVIALKRYSLT
jgi:hypothetical protein